MTALAIVVSFGLTGCLTSNDSPADVKPATPIAKEEQGKPQTKPTTKPEEPKPTTKPEESKPTTKPEESTPTTKPEETKPQPEPEKIVSVDSKNNKWRIIAMNGDNASLSNKVHNESHNGYNGTMLSRDARDTYAPEECDVFNCTGSVIHNHGGVNAITAFDLDELAQKDGKPFLGVHSGTFTDNDLSGYVVDAYTNEKGELVTTAKDAKNVNYLFVNQPYSSYGMFYTNENDVSAFFQGLRAGKEDTDNEFTVVRNQVVRGQTTDKIIWNDSMKGNATYKGQAIALVSTYQPPHFEELRHIPKVDGTITLNAQFGDRWERTYISDAELDSNTIGKVALGKAAIHLYGSFGEASTKEAIGSGYKLGGEYEAQFYGKDFNDVAGRVSLRLPQDAKPNKGDVVRYTAVFGGTKQPK